MFDSRFEEEKLLHHNSTPTTKLEEDDPEAIETMFRLLHYQFAYTVHINAKRLAVLHYIAININVTNH